MRKKVKKKRQLQPAKITVRSAHNLNDAELNKIRQLLGKDLEVATEVQQDLLGGIEIKRSNDLFDATIRTQLNQLRDKLYKLKTYERYS